MPTNLSMNKKQIITHYIGVSLSFFLAIGLFVSHLQGSMGLTVIVVIPVVGVFGLMYVILGLFAIVHGRSSRIFLANYFLAAFAIFASCFVVGDNNDEPGVWFMWKEYASVSELPPLVDDLAIFMFIGFLAMFPAAVGVSTLAMVRVPKQQIQ